LFFFLQTCSAISSSKGNSDEMNKKLSGLSVDDLKSKYSIQSNETIKTVTFAALGKLKQ